MNNDDEQQQTSFEMLLDINRKLRRMKEGRLQTNEEPFTIEGLQVYLSALEDRMRKGSRMGFFRMSIGLFEEMMCFPDGMRFAGFQSDMSDSEHGTISVLIAGEPLPSLSEGQAITEVDMQHESFRPESLEDLQSGMYPYRLLKMVRIGELAGDTGTLWERKPAEEE